MIAGIYKAKIKDYGIYEGKDETKNHAKVIFSVEDNTTSDVLPETKEFTWNGYFTGGAKAITVKTLVETFGLDLQNYKNFNDGIGSHAINEDVTYEVELADEEYNGKKTLKIKYVNLPGATRRAAKLDKDKASIFLAGLNLEAEIISAKQPTKLNTAEPIPF